MFVATRGILPCRNPGVTQLSRGLKQANPTTRWFALWPRLRSSPCQTERFLRDVLAVHAVREHSAAACLFKLHGSEADDDGGQMPQPPWRVGNESEQDGFRKVMATTHGSGGSSIRTRPSTLSRFPNLGNVAQEPIANICGTTDSRVSLVPYKTTAFWPLELNQASKCLRLSRGREQRWTAL